MSEKRTSAPLADLLAGLREHGCSIELTTALHKQWYLKVHNEGLGMRQAYYYPSLARVAEAAETWLEVIGAMEAGADADK